MGVYIDRSDIEARFGSANVAAWSQLDNDQTSAVEDRITTAISQAEAEVDDRFREGRYTLPFSPTSGSAVQKVVDWSAKLAGVWLYFSRGFDDTGDQASREVARMTEIKTVVHAEIDEYVAGSRKLAAAVEEDGPSAPVAVRRLSG